MGARTDIEWCDHTVNFWWGCEKVSPACEHCYAEGIAKRFSKGKANWGKDGLRMNRQTAAITELKRLDKSARKRGVRERVFIESMGDMFEDRPDLAMPRNMFFVIAEKVTNLDLLLLTKRPQNVLPMLEKIRKHWLADKLPLFPHIWIGTTVENQKMADKRIPALLEIPAKVRFLSCEPMLEHISLIYSGGIWNGPCPDDYSYGTEGRIDWVICGCESGGKRRPMQEEWARSLHNQCASAGVPFFMKQMEIARRVTADLSLFPEDLRERNFPTIEVNP